MPAGMAAIPRKTGKKRQMNIAKVPHRSKKAVHARQSFVREVDVLSIAFYQRHAAEPPDRVADRASAQLARKGDGDR